ncbi:MAG TPA: acyltransferase [Myxococcus sp.]|nr:acyltransferase [Myxococcus sp.]
MHSNFAPGAQGPRLKGHLPVLDGVRGLAVLLVVLYHTIHMNAENALGRAAWWLAGAGWAGVDLFFVLSGFLITGILWEAKGQPFFFRNFYMRRFLRIFPLYYLTLALCFLVLPALSGRVHLDDRITTDGAVWYLLYLSNFYQLWVDTTHPVLGVVWSLAIEEQFYIVWPFLIAAVSYRGAIRLCLGTIALAILVRLGLTLSGASLESTYVTTFARVDALAMGGLLALALRHPEGLGLAAFRWMKWGFWAALPVVAVMVALPPGEAYELVKRTVGYTAVAVLFAGFVYRAVEASPGQAVHRFFNSGLLRTYGKYSYAVYLIHSPVDALLRRTVLKMPLQFIWGTDLFMQLVYFAVAGGVSLALAVVSWNLYEKHFLKLKDYFPYGAQPPAPVAGVQAEVQAVPVSPGAAR